MGLYWNTYLCSGKFVCINDATIYKQILLASMDQIIEEEEWEKKVVDKNELLRYINCQQPKRNSIHQIKKWGNRLIFNRNLYEHVGLS